MTEPPTEPEVKESDTDIIGGRGEYKEERKEEKEEKKEEDKDSKIADQERVIQPQYINSPTNRDFDTEFVDNYPETKGNNELPNISTGNRYDDDILMLEEQLKRAKRELRELKNDCASKKGFENQKYTPPLLPKPKGIEIKSFDCCNNAFTFANNKMTDVLKGVTGAINKTNIPGLTDEEKNLLTSDSIKQEEERIMAFAFALIKSAEINI